MLHVIVAIQENLEVTQNLQEVLVVTQLRQEALEATLQPEVAQEGVAEVHLEALEDNLAARFQDKFLTN